MVLLVSEAGTNRWICHKPHSQLSRTWHSLRKTIKRLESGYFLPNMANIDGISRPPRAAAVSSVNGQDPQSSLIMLECPQDQLRETCLERSRAPHKNLPLICGEQKSLDGFIISRLRAETNRRVVISPSQLSRTWHSLRKS